MQELNRLLFTALELAGKVTYTKLDPENIFYNIDELISSLTKKVATFEEDDEGVILLHAIKSVINRIKTSKEQMNIKSILSYLKINLQQSIELYDDLHKEVIEILEVEGIDEDTLITQVRALNKEIRDWLMMSEGASLLFSYASKLKASTTGGDFEKSLAIYEELNEITDSYLREADSAESSVIETLDFDNNDDVISNFETMLAGEAVDGASRITSGSTKFDEAICGSFRKGKLVCHTALQYKNKSGFLRSLLVGMAISNYPEISEVDVNKGYHYKDLDDGRKVLIDSTGNEVEHTLKPLILKISYEDELDEDIKFLYRYFTYLDKGEVLSSFEGIDLSEAANYVSTRLKQNGFHFAIIRATPGESSFQTIIDTCEKYNNTGYRVDILGMDYLNLVSNKGCSVGVIGDDVMDKFRRIRDYLAINNILGLTPHQLRTAAKDVLLDEGVTDRDFPRAIAGGGFTSGSRSIDRELDMLMNIHITHHTDDKYYQVVFVEKVRGAVIPANKQHFYIEFIKDTPLIITDDFVRYTLPVSGTG